MNEKNKLFKELNKKGRENFFCTSLDVNVKKIKQKTEAKLTLKETERKMYFMKKRKRVLIIAIAATLVLSSAAFAANGIVAGWFGSSCSIPEYRSLPTKERVIKDVGFEPVLKESFENGYTFKNGSVVNNRLKDENGKLLEKFKSVSFRYEKNGDTVYFSQDKFNSETEKQGYVIANINETDIYYHSYKNKLVPPDYKLTEEDKEMENSGELTFSYGADKTEINMVQCVMWEKNGTLYQLMQINGNLPKEELVNMASESINKTK